MAGAKRSRWALLAAVIAAGVVAPLAILPLSFLTDPGAFSQVADDLLPQAARASVVLALGVGAGTLALGGSLAVLVSFYDFPGRRWLDWALVLPLAMPGYVLVFVLLGQYDASSALQEGLRSLFGAGFQLPEVRSAAGAIVVLTLVLYPYAYVLGRAAFMAQSRELFDAARTLGLAHRRAVLRVAIPAGRSAVAAGAALAMMEALADFGTVNLLNYRAMTDAIYRVWYGAFDRAAALQLATLLLTLTFALFALQRLLRGRGRHLDALARGEAVAPRRLHGPAAVAAAVLPTTLLALVLGAPVAQLVVWTLDSLGDGAGAGDLARSAALSLLLALLAALITTAAAALIVYGARARPSRAGRVATRLATLGYALPGTIVAVAVYVPLAWIDRRIGQLVLTGSVLGLLAAYLVRFQALAVFSVEARMRRIDPGLDDAARNLGAGPGRVLADVHLPLLWPGLVTAALLVFVEVMKELPATALLRPLGGDTLAVAVWEATKDSRFDTAALPALMIVVAGLVPIALMVRLSRAASLEEARTAGLSGRDER